MRVGLLRLTEAYRLSPGMGAVARIRLYPPAVTVTSWLTVAPLRRLPSTVGLSQAGQTRSGTRPTHWGPPVRRVTVYAPGLRFWMVLA